MEYIINFFSFKPLTTTSISNNQLLDELCSNPVRVRLTNKLLKYINQNNLQDDNDINSVILDDNLAIYFKCNVGQKLTYYEMQELLNLDEPFKLEMPNGFSRLLKLSDELCQFLDMKSSSKLSRIDVIKKLCSYIETQQLKDEDNKRFIVLDEKLANLFKSEVGERITYYEIQRLLQPHLSSNYSDGFLVFE